MMPRNGYNYNLLRISLERALSVLGESSKQILLFYMAEHCGISFDRKCSLAEIESALRSVLGSGSAIITKRMYKELQSMTE
ncbi:MAG: hypothetical protein QXX64_00565 [Nitrososphaera sp.]|uniref:Uncharacterized protein n=1 Tax=Nitrososphaera gargensis (strain Ga9.2) TaxID=1237085 RepID=K0IEJ0_NITGG|nr:hypothetical protein [Candidatus Nitrososphaera gargensis]AFU59766.1 hypothetical protein Ngar_c28460 [Candidatus Nitrososphaera gargensis Ga9.2]